MSKSLPLLPMLHVGMKHVLFEPCNSLSDIFYDKQNQKIITVRNDGSLGITVKGFNKDDVCNFRIVSTQKIETVSFATDLKVGSVHRDTNSVDIFFFDAPPKGDLTAPTLVNQSCKVSSSVVLTVEWVAKRQFCIITDNGLELYQVDTKRKSCKFLKTCNVAPVWSVFYPTSQLIICASGLDCGVMNPFIIQKSQIHRLARFVVDFGYSNERPTLTDHDVLIASIYGIVYFLVVKSDAEGIVCQVNMYEISANVNVPSKLVHVLVFDAISAYSLHVIDNLVIVYNQASIEAFIFDIQLCPNNNTISLDVFTSGQFEPLKHKPVLRTPMSIDSTIDAVIDPGTFVMLSPNVIADPRFGVFADVSLNLSNACHLITDKEVLLRFMMNRTDAKELMLKVFKDMILMKCLSVTKLCDVFCEIFDAPKPPVAFKMSLLPKVDSVKFNVIGEIYVPMRVDQSTILRVVFEPLRENSKVDKGWLSNVLLEFLLILKRNRVVVDKYLPELVITILSDAEEFNRLQQLLQHRVIEDSRFLAFRLFEISKLYKPFFQQGIDMLARRGNFGQIVIQLLQRGQIVEAMRYLPRTADIDTETCLRILEAAWATESRQTKYAVFIHLRDIMKVACMNEQCFDKYSFDFETLFNFEEIKEAEHRFRLARISSSTPLSDRRASETSSESFTLSFND